MPRPPRRERLLITRDGWVFVQEDPSEHTVPVVVLTVGEHVVRFFFEATVLVPPIAGERPLLVSTYLEEDETAEGGGNGDDPLVER
jgi:hypothetical protein